jgi:hypothetical protein
MINFSVSDILNKYSKDNALLAQKKEVNKISVSCKEITGLYLEKGNVEFCIKDVFNETLRGKDEGLYVLENKKLYVLYLFYIHENKSESKYLYFIIENGEIIEKKKEELVEIVFEVFKNKIC